MRIAADVFPAVIAIAPEGSIELSELLPKGQAPDKTRKVSRCRVVVLDNFLMIVRDYPDTPQKLIFREELLTLAKDKDGVWRGVTENNKLIAFRKDKDCDCGTTLASWNPYAWSHSV